VKAFAPTILRKQAEDDDGAQELLALALLEYRESRSADQAEIISQTDERQMVEAIAEARAMQIEEGGATDNRTIAAVAATLLRRKFKARAESIATYETQSAAESTKMAEAQVTSGRAPSIGGEVTRRPERRITPATKTWQTMGDNRVRASHRAVNGQTVPIDQPFQVGTSMLMYPADSSLGADAKEIVNCRCSARYRFGG
jgi:hypothetical protein